MDKSSSRDWWFEHVCAGDMTAMIDSHLKAINQSGQRGRTPSPRGGRVARNPRNQSPRAPREKSSWDGSCWQHKSKTHKRDECNTDRKHCDPNGGKTLSSYVSEYNLGPIASLHRCVLRALHPEKETQTKSDQCQEVVAHDNKCTTKQTLVYAHVTTGIYMLIHIYMYTCPLSNRMSVSVYPSTRPIRSCMCLSRNIYTHKLLV